MRRQLFVIVTIVGCLTLSLRAQSGQSGVPVSQNAVGPNTFGLSDFVALTIGAYEFIPFDSSTTFSGIGAGQRYLTSSGAWFAPVQVPNGVAIEGIELSACTFAAVVTASLYSAEKSQQLETNHGAVSKTGGSTCTTVQAPLGAPVIVNNATRVYYVVVTMASNLSTSFNSVTLYYRLRVSPAAAVATFADVPVGHPQRQFIEALAASGITGGCGHGSYCPDAPLTRGQMAVFLAAALGLHWPN